MLIGCLATAERRTAKIGFHPICYGTAVTAQWQLERQWRNGIFHVCNVILMALTEFLRNFLNGNGRMATEGWKPGITVTNNNAHTHIHTHINTILTAIIQVNLG